MKRILLALILSASAAAAAQDAPQTDVSIDRLRATIERLVGFGTRHTLSDYDNATRGIGAANRWAEQEFRRIAEGCGGCLTVALPEDRVSGTRIPTPTRLVDVLAIQRGSERPNEVVIISAHIDSRASDVMDATRDAPGANDNGSGTAAVLEAARVLSRHRYPVTIVYALLSGEEQGLYGGRLLASYAAAQGWTVKAQLNNDIVGGSSGSDGARVGDVVRVFSEGQRADGSDAYRARVRREGGENDSPSRNLSRYIDGVASGQRLPIAVRQVWRADRFGRGGDQFPLQDLGFPAVRITAGIEDYNHQHQNVRTENGVRYGDTIDAMDFAYLARVTQLNVAVLAALASTPMPPAPVVEGAVSPDTTLHWPTVAGALSYRVYRRRTDERDWGNAVTVAATAGEQTAITLPGVRVDDWLFGVSAVGAGDAESPVASAVPGGAFAPLPR